MIPSRSLVPRISRVALVTALMVSAVPGAASARGQGQTSEPAPKSKLSDAERVRKLAERDRYWQEANRLYQAGKLEDAVSALMRELAIDREVLGGMHEQVVSLAR